MFKLFVFACILAFVAAEAKPGLIAPITSSLAYTAPLTYSSSYVYSSPLTYAPAYYKSYYSAPLAYAYGSYYY